MTGIFLHGNLGQSLRSSDTVTTLVLHRLPVTLELGALALLMSMLAGIPIGIYSSIRQDSVGDYISRSIAILAISVPHFWIGIMVMLYPSIYLNWSPPIEYVHLTEDPIGNIKMMLIPAAILAMILSGQVMRMTRTMMLEVLRQDYVRTAYAKGLRERIVISRHTVKECYDPCDYSPRDLTSVPDRRLACHRADIRPAWHRSPDAVFAGGQRLHYRLRRKLHRRGLRRHVQRDNRHQL